MSKLRVERWHNGHTRAVANHGEQDVEYRVDKPTMWSVAFHHPALGECFEIKHFNSIKERTEYIKQKEEEYKYE